MSEERDLPPGYEHMSPEQRAAVDRMIEISEEQGWPVSVRVIEHVPDNVASNRWVIELLFAVLIIPGLVAVVMAMWLWVAWAMDWTSLFDVSAPWGERISRAWLASSGGALMMTFVNDMMGGR